MQKSHKSISEGFTLIETILYVALIVIMLSALLPFSLVMISNAAKSSTDQEVYSAAQYVSEELLYQIRNASSVNIGSSSFGTDFVASSGAMLSLAETSSTVNPTTIKVASGTLVMTRGTSSAVSLNSSLTSVASLIFSNYSTNTFNNIGFILTVSDSYTSTKNEYVASTTIKTSAELRGK